MSSDTAGHLIDGIFACLGIIVAATATYYSAGAREAGRQAHRSAVAANNSASAARDNASAARDNASDARDTASEARDNAAPMANGFTAKVVRELGELRNGMTLMHTDLQAMARTQAQLAKSQGEIISSMGRRDEIIAHHLEAHAERDLRAKDGS